MIREGVIGEGGISDLFRTCADRRGGDRQPNMFCLNLIKLRSQRGKDVQKKRTPCRIGDIQKKGGNQI